MLDAGYSGFKQIARLREETQHILTGRLEQTRWAALRDQAKAWNEEQAVAFAPTRIQQALTSL